MYVTQNLLKTTCARSIVIKRIRTGGDGGGEAQNWPLGGGGKFFQKWGGGESPYQGVTLWGGGEKIFWVKGGDKKFSRALRAREKK